MPFTFSQLSVPAGWTTGIGRNVAWSPSGDYLIAAASATPFAKVFNRVGDVLSSGTALSPLPTADTTIAEWAGTVDQSFALYYFANPNYTHPYTMSGGAATKVSDINGYASGVNRYSPDGQFLLLPYQSPSWLRIYKNNPATGVISTNYSITSYGGTGVAPNTTVWDVAFSPDNSKMVLGTLRASHTVQAYDVTSRDDSGGTIAFNHHGYDNTFILNAQITCIKFHPTNPRYFIVCSTSAASGFAGVHLYDFGTSTSSGLKKIATLTGQSATEVAMNAEWSADGTMLLAAFAGTMAVWSFDETTATFSNKATQTISSYASSHRCSLHKVNDTTSYAAVAHSTSALNSQMTFWKINNISPLDARAQVPAIGAKAVLSNRLKVIAKAGLQAIGAKAQLNNYTLEYPAAVPFEENPPDIYLDAFQPPWTEAQINGVAISSDYGAQITDITTKITFSATIAGDYGKQDAFLLEAYPITIDVSYGAQMADVNVDVLADYVDINSDYGAQIVDISEIVVPNAHINYDYGAQITDILVGMDAAPVILSDYGKQLTDIETSGPVIISYDYGKQEADVEVEDPIGVIVAETYGKQLTDISAALPITVNIAETYGKQLSDISASLSGGTIDTSYGKQTADIFADIGKFIDMNYAYGKQEATINVGVSGRGRITFMLIQP